MKTEITLIINGLSVAFDLTFKGTMYNYEVESLHWANTKEDAYELIEQYTPDIEEAIVNYFVGEAETKGERWSEEGRLDDDAEYEEEEDRDAW